MWARGHGNGRSKREYTAKSDTSSPTVSLEAMMMSCASDTKENRYMAIADTCQYGRINLYVQFPWHLMNNKA